MPERELSGSLVGRLVGGTLILVVLGTAVVGLVLGTRTARLYARFEAQLAAAARAELSARLRGTVEDLTDRIGRADETEDWTPLQAALPARAVADPDLRFLAVTDRDGLILAGADPSRNGRPLPDERLRPLLGRAEPTNLELVLDGRPVLLTAARVRSTDETLRYAWVGVSLERVRKAEAAVRQAGRDAVRFGWVLVGLGGLIVALVAAGAVVVIGGSVARRLQVLSWRIGQLGRGDRTTHLQLDGSEELQQVGRELDLAARRIATADESLRAQSVQAGVAQARVSLVRDALSLPPEIAGLQLAQAAPAAPIGSAAGATSSATGGLVWMVERLGEELEDVVAAAELRTVARVLADGAAPAMLLERLDRVVAADKHKARALIAAIGPDGRVELVSAGARLPLLRRRGAAPRPVLVRGDRLGESAAAREPAVTVTLAPGDELYLLGEPPPPSAAARDGQVPHAFAAALKALSADASLEARAEAIAAAAAGAVVVIARPG